MFLAAAATAGQFGGGDDPVRGSGPGSRQGLGLGLEGCSSAVKGRTSLPGAASWAPRRWSLSFPESQRGCLDLTMSGRASRCSGSPVGPSPASGLSVLPGGRSRVCGSCVVHFSYFCPGGSLHVHVSRSRSLVLGGG